MLSFILNEISESVRSHRNRTIYKMRPKDVSLLVNGKIDEFRQRLLRFPYLHLEASYELRNLENKPEFIKNLCHALEGTSINNANLSFNNLGSIAVNVFVCSPFFKKLLSLDLRYNQLKDEGAKAVALALPGSPLKILQLDGNQIDNAGGTALFSMLKQSNMHNLTLQDNMFQDITADNLIGLDSSNLKHLNVLCNNLSIESQRAFLAILPKTNLLSLDIQFTNIDKRYELNKILKENNAKLKQPRPALDMQNNGIFYRRSQYKKIRQSEIKQLAREAKAFIGEEIPDYAIRRRRSHS